MTAKRILAQTDVSLFFRLRQRNSSVLVMAAATVPATALQVLALRHPTKLQGLADKSVNGFLNALHRRLGIQKTPGDRVFQESFALRFELRDLFLRELQTLGLLMMQVFPLFADTHVLRTRVVVDHELVHMESMLLEFRLGEDGSAQVFEAFLNGLIECGHG